eukprot:492025-Amphidinium_carterae.1
MPADVWRSVIYALAAIGGALNFCCVVGHSVNLAFDYVQLDTVSYWTAYIPGSTAKFGRRLQEDADIEPVLFAFLCLVSVLVG